MNAFTEHLKLLIERDLKEEHPKVFIEFSKEEIDYIIDERLRKLAEYFYTIYQLEEK